MKQFKFLSGIILFVILVIVIFSTTNATQNSFKDQPAGISTTCPLKIHLGSGSCLVPPYSYCIGGGSRITVTTDTFTVYLNSGSTSTICVENSGHSCSGSLSYSMPSPCPTPTRDTTITLNKNGVSCSCTND
jgi:hypothetical protein